MMKSRMLGVGALTAVAAALALPMTSPAQPAPVAHAAAKCSVAKDGRKLGATYVTSLSTTRVSCAAAKKVVKAYHACRRAAGGADGVCKKRVKGYRCTERRQAIKTEFDAKATCKAGGSKKIVFAYTQFT